MSIFCLLVLYRIAKILSPGSISLSKMWLVFNCIEAMVVLEKVAAGICVASQPIHFTLMVQMSVIKSYGMILFSSVPQRYQNLTSWQ